MQVKFYAFTYISDVKGHLQLLSQFIYRIQLYETFCETLIKFNAFNDDKQTFSPV